MKYRDIIGYSKKEEKKKITLKPTAPPVIELLKEEFGDTINEGPAYEYAKYTKNIEKSWSATKKSVMNLAKELKKKGFKDEAFTIEKKFQASYNNFDHYFEDIMNKLQ